MPQRVCGVGCQARALQTPFAGKPHLDLFCADSRKRKFVDVAHTAIDPLGILRFYGCNQFLPVGEKPYLRALFERRNDKFDIREIGATFCGERAVAVILEIPYGRRIR